MKQERKLKPIFVLLKGGPQSTTHRALLQLKCVASSAVKSYKHICSARDLIASRTSRDLAFLFLTLRASFNNSASLLFSSSTSGFAVSLADHNFIEPKFRSLPEYKRLPSELSRKLPLSRCPAHLTLPQAAGKNHCDNSSGGNQESGAGFVLDSEDWKEAFEFR
ncbi:hypothetical protein DM860_014159 [Cuscuta australis]|uniref:Uncharacterized protein n=1 Tax=Cuscuta australis TaxID=267555 RepID=A0A328DDM4_9ASTE|nr:hypothetical protein DM860_014159 [Cuscuta australis]